MREYYTLVRKEMDSHPLLAIIVIGLSIAMLIFLAACFITGGSSAYFAMFPDKNDIFMDYFNSIFYSMDNPYTKYDVIYPPLITAIYGYIGNLLMLNGVLSGLDIRASYTGMFSYIVLTMVLIFLLIRLQEIQFPKGFKYLKSPLILLLILSFPALFAIMRGNNILYAVVFVGIFLMTYKSDNKYVRILGYISLGMAVGLKAYPALFWCLVVRERSIKESLLCLLTIIILFMGPFLLTDGSLKIMLDNSLSLTTEPYFKYLINFNDIYSGLYTLGLDEQWVSKLTVLSSILSYLLTFIIVCFSKKIKNWECVALISCNLVMGLGASATYLFVFLLVAILPYLNEEKELNAYNILFCILFILIFAIFPSVTEGDETRAVFISIKGMSVFLMYSLIVLRMLFRKEQIGDCGSFTWERKNSTNAQV